MVFSLYCTAELIFVLCVFYFVLVNHCIVCFYALYFVLYW